MRIDPLERIDQRFREELREQKLPDHVRLHGNAMLVQVANKLLLEHSEVMVAPHAETIVHLMSMEQYCAAFVKAFLEEVDPPKGPFLLHTIPEAELISYAQQHHLPVVEEKDDVRRMLDKIAQKQPQTYFSLTRSAQRLREAAELLRGNLSEKR